MRRVIMRLPASALIASVRFYQRCVSPMLGSHCRFQPTCSEYFVESVRKHGAARGAWQGTKRILKCHPLYPGGYDPPK